MLCTVLHVEIEIFSFPARVGKRPEKADRGGVGHHHLQPGLAEFGGHALPVIGRVLGALGSGHPHLRRQPAAVGRGRGQPGEGRQPSE